LVNAQVGPYNYTVQVLLNHNLFCPADEEGYPECLTIDSWNNPFNANSQECNAMECTYGCTDLSACNFNSEVGLPCIEDCEEGQTGDNCCCYYTFLCWDGQYYDGCDDSACPPQPGCMDSLAWNYNPAAAVDDGSCEYICGVPDEEGNIQPGPICMCCDENYENCEFRCNGCTKEGWHTIHCWSTVGIYCEWPNICCEDLNHNGVCDNHPSDWILSCDSCGNIDCSEPPCDEDWQNAPPEYNWDGFACEQIGQITCEDGSCAVTIEGCPEYTDPLIGDLIGYVYRKIQNNRYQFNGPYPECNNTKWDLDNDGNDDFYVSWYRHGYSNDNPIWNEYDEEMPELTCAAVFGLYCGNHTDNPYSGDSAHGTNPNIWKDWWSRSSDPNDYIAVECSSNEDGIYYQCHERLEYTEPEYIQCFRCLSNTDCEPNEICNFDAESATEDYGCCEVPLFGDVNLDNRVNIQDIILLVDYILGFVDNLTEYQIALADVNQDGIININDVTQLINSILNNRTLENNRRELQRQLDRLRLEPNKKQKLIDEILRKQKNG